MSVGTNQSIKTLAGWTFGSAFVCVLVFTAISCRAPQPAPSRGPTTTDPAPYGPYPEPPFVEAKNAALHVPVPEIANAEYVNDDSLCMTCHETFVKTFQHNVHRDHSCEKCHGPASRHLQTRGKEPGTILSFKTLSAPERAEICLKCHEQDACSPGTQWRSSPHAAHGVSCTDCHTSHYNVPPGTPITTVAQAGQPDGNLRLVRLPSPDEDANKPATEGTAEKEKQDDMASILAESNHLGAVTPQICYRCHANLAQQVRRCRLAPDLWCGRVQLHDVPQSPRQAAAGISHRSLPQMPRQQIADHGLAFVDSLQKRRRLCGLP